MIGRRGTFELASGFVVGNQKSRSVHEEVKVMSDWFNRQLEAK